jgi:hypothetical protein
MIWAHRLSGYSVEMYDMVQKPDAPDYLYLLARRTLPYNSPGPFTDDYTLVINWRGDLNFVEWAKSFGNTNIAGANGRGTNAYALKFHPDLNHIYLAGKSGNWRQAANDFAGWLVKFDLTNQVIKGEVTLDISTSGEGTVYTDMEVTQ